MVNNQADQAKQSTETTAGSPVLDSTKWAVDDEVLKARHQGKELEKYQKYVLTGDELKKLKNKTINVNGVDVQFLHEWITYPKGDEKFKEPISQADQERYELFCYGYLYFYDHHVTRIGKDKQLHESPQHVIYFDWTPNGNDNGSKVSIFLAPGARFLPDREVNYIRYVSGQSDPPPPPPPPPPPIG